MTRRTKRFVVEIRDGDAWRDAPDPTVLRNRTAAVKMAVLYEKSGYSGNARVIDPNGEVVYGPIDDDRDVAELRDIYRSTFQSCLDDGYSIDDAHDSAVNNTYDTAGELGYTAEAALMATTRTRSNPAVEPSRGYSEGTSLAQVPALHKLVLKHGGWKRGDVNADIGGGKYDLATEFLASHGVHSYVYDPGNRTKAHNERVLRAIEDGRADTATIANVLNVIPDAGVRQQVLKLAKNAVRPGGAVFISIYEGNGTGAGRETPKGWQENRKTKSFLPEVQRVFPGAIVKRGIIVAEA